MAAKTPQETTVVAAADDVPANSDDVAKRSELEKEKCAVGIGPGNETVIIRFAKPDEDNPFDWRPAKKW